MRQDDSDAADFLVVLRAQAGDEDAFASLFRSHSEATGRYLSRMVDPMSAEDLNQEVWLTVYRRIGELSGATRFKPWLFRIARNRAIDWLRAARRKSTLLELSARSLADEQAELGDLEQADDLSGVSIPFLRASMDQLSPVHREVIVLRFWEDLSYSEMATVMQCSIGTVRSRLYHAKKNLERLLEAESEYPPNQAGDEQ